MGEIKNPYKDLVGRSDGRKPPGGPKHRREDLLKRVLKIMCAECFNLAGDIFHLLAVVRMVINLLISQNVWGFERAWQLF